MTKNNEEDRKCKFCGKTLVGNNKSGVCAGCKKKAGDKGAAALSILAGIGMTALTIFKAFSKKD